MGDCDAVYVANVEPKKFVGVREETYGAYYSLREDDALVE